MADSGGDSKGVAEGKTLMLFKQCILYHVRSQDVYWTF